MTFAPRLGSLVLLALAVGCDETPAGLATSINATPEAVLAPKAPDEKDPAAKPAVAAAGDVRLETISIDDLTKRIAADTKAKCTIVDVWSTTCGPCMENFPHVVAMHKTYAGQGLSVITLATDDPEDAKAVQKARDFLKKQKAVMTNYLDATFQDVFEKFDFTTQPAVFLFGPDGKMLKKFTWDDPDDQFTYDQVERAVQALLKGEPLPDSGKKADKADAKGSKA